MNPSSAHLKRRFATAVLALLLALAVATAATFAWYIYNTSAHTTRVHMAAGTSVALSISSTGAPDSYSSSAVLDAFTGTLNPVSTNKIANGFQKVYGFTDGSENQPNLVASLFGKSATADYYKTKLYLKTDGPEMSVYLADTGKAFYTDSDPDNPISTAIRVGFVNAATGQEFIYAINTAHNPKAEYNTQNGQPGDVMDSTKTDGTTVTFTPLTPDNFCTYDPTTGETTVKTASTMLCTASETPVQLDVYIWLEGCDEDCTDNLCATTLKNLALAFCGVAADSDAANTAAAQS